jgi:hypothetical protein
VSLLSQQISHLDKLNKQRAILPGDARHRVNVLECERELEGVVD